MPPMSTNALSLWEPIWVVKMVQHVKIRQVVIVAFALVDGREFIATVKRRTACRQAANCVDMERAFKLRKNQDINASVIRDGRTMV